MWRCLGQCRRCWYRGGSLQTYLKISFSSTGSNMKSRLTADSTMKCFRNRSRHVSPYSRVLQKLPPQFHQTMIKKLRFYSYAILGLAFAILVEARDAEAQLNALSLIGADTSTASTTPSTQTSAGSSTSSFTATVLIASRSPVCSTAASLTSSTVNAFIGLKDLCRDLDSRSSFKDIFPIVFYNNILVYLSSDRSLCRNTTTDSLTTT